MPQNVSENLAASRLWQFIDNNNVLEASDWADLLPDQSNQLFLNSSLRKPVFDYYEAYWNLTLEFLNFSNNSSLRYCGVP